MSVSKPDVKFQVVSFNTWDFKRELTRGVVFI